MTDAISSNRPGATRAQNEVSRETPKADTKTAGSSALDTFEMVADGVALAMSPMGTLAAIPQAFAGAANLIKNPTLENAGTQVAMVGASFVPFGKPAVAAGKIVRGLARGASEVAEHGGAAAARVGAKEIAERGANEAIAGLTRYTQKLGDEVLGVLNKFSGDVGSNMAALGAKHGGQIKASLADAQQKLAYAKDRGADPAIIAGLEKQVATFKATLDVMANPKSADALAQFFLSQGKFPHNASEDVLKTTWKLAKALKDKGGDEATATLARLHDALPSGAAGTMKALKDVTRPPPGFSSGVAIGR